MNYFIPAGKLQAVVSCRSKHRKKSEQMGLEKIALITHTHTHTHTHRGLQSVLFYTMPWISDSRWWWWCWWWWWWWHNGHFLLFLLSSPLLSSLRCSALTFGVKRFDLWPNTTALRFSSCRLFLPLCTLWIFKLLIVFSCIAYAYHSALLLCTFCLHKVQSRGKWSCKRHKQCIT